MQKGDISTPNTQYTSNQTADMNIGQRITLFSKRARSPTRHPYTNPLLRYDPHYEPNIILPPPTTSISSLLTHSQTKCLMPVRNIGKKHNKIVLNITRTPGSYTYEDPPTLPSSEPPGVVLFLQHSGGGHRPGGWQTCQSANL